MRQPDRHGKIDRRIGAGPPQQLPIRIIAQRGDERHGYAEIGQVLGNVAANATRRDCYLARVRYGGHEGSARTALDVDVGTANDDDARHQKSVGAPPSALRFSTKALSSSLIAGSMAGS